MLWGSMAASGTGRIAFVDTTMDRFGYLNTLKTNLLPSVEKLGLTGSWIFQQDNDPKHTACIVQEWLLYKTPKQLRPSPQSPDLNPIEHLWEILDENIRETTITSKETLKTALLKAWDNIAPETC